MKLPASNESLVCPVCGEPNQCAGSAAGSTDPPCWCASVTFSPELLARVPPNMQRKACICRSCAEGQGAMPQK
ncbi:MAG: cysteine-rich CWC family protein [Rubrivivax sp.]